MGLFLWADEHRHCKADYGVGMGSNKVHERVQRILGFQIRPRSVGAKVGTKNYVLGKGVRCFTFVTNTNHDDDDDDDDDDNDDDDGINTRGTIRGRR